MLPLSWIREKDEKANPRFASYASLVWELIKLINMVAIT